MSEFSGKCDVYDRYGDVSDEYLQNSRFFIYSEDGKHHELKINNQKDLAKYYPYLVSSSSGGKNGACVNISSYCFIDKEEEEMMGWLMHDLIKYYKKCKRNKIPYDVDEALKHTCWFTPAEWEKELARRVGEYGERASTKGVYRPLHDHFRMRWYEELVQLGYDEKEARIWIYGWERVLNEQKEKRSEKENIQTS